MTCPGVSFVMPVYNKADWLPAVLEQVQRQRGDFERQYIFIDDGSTDQSLDIVRDVTSGWENVVIETQKNAGSAAATNRGIALAELDYVKFVDADDLLHTEATRVLLDVLQGRKNACLAYGNKKHFTSLEELDLDLPLDLSHLQKEGTVLQKPLKKAIYNSLFNPTQFLARTEALKAVGGCDERVVFSQEYALTMRLARQWDFIHLDADLAFLPFEVGQRLSNNEGRQLQRVTKAVAYFLRDFDDIPWVLRQQIARRMASRAWKYHRRINGKAWLTSPVFWRQVRSWMPILGSHADFVDRCCTVFDTADLRVVDQEM